MEPVTRVARFQGGLLQYSDRFRQQFVPQVNKSLRVEQFRASSKFIDYREAAKRYATIPELIEAIATLRLSQQRYDDAVQLYEQAEALAPKNARILNNLAMALSEIPGRESEALPKIQLAVDEFGRSPELLDTQGLVYLRNKLLSEAVTVLQEATLESSDPRYRFHLIMALLQSGDKKKAISQWAQLNLRQLRQMPLTPGELKDLSEIEREFGKQT